MKFTLNALALAVAGTALSPLAAQAQTVNTVKVVVAYTADALAWANEQKVTCPTLLSTTATKQALAKIKALTNIGHVCESSSTLGRSSSYIDNVINIAIAETNKVYKDSGINNINLVLADRFLVSSGGVNYKEGLLSSELSHPEPAVLNQLKYQTIPIEMIKLRNRNDTKNSNVSILNMVHARRAAVQGDIVVMLTGPKSNDYTNTDGSVSEMTPGVAAAIGADNPDEGFAVLTADLATAPAFTFAHEVSHLFGANHYDIRIQGPYLLNISQDVLAGTPFMVDNKISAWGFYDSTYQWKWQDPLKPANTLSDAKGYRDLMTYGDYCDCVALPILSTLNPGAGVNRIPYGTANDASGKRRDNASAVAAGAAKIAGFGERLSSMADPVLATGAKKIGLAFGEYPAYGINDNNGFTYDAKYDLRVPANLNWNNITSLSDTAEKALINQSGQNSGVRLAITAPFAQRSFIAAFQHDGKAPYLTQGALAYGLDEMPAMAMADGLVSKRAQQGKFELRGLNPNATYFFKLYGSQEAGANIRVAHYQIKGAGGVVQDVALPTHGNLFRFGKLKGVKPQSNGVIEIAVVPDAAVPDNASVPLNAIEFYQHQ